MKIIFMIIAVVTCVAGLLFKANGVPNDFLTHGLLFAILANVWSWK